MTRALSVVVSGVVVASIALASLSGCSHAPRSDDPLTFGGEESESCISNPAGRDVFIGQIVQNDSHTPVKIMAVWPEEATGVEPLWLALIKI